MALSPQKLREIVCQLLYGYDSMGEMDESTVFFVMNLLKVTKKSVKEAISCAESVWKKRDELDKYISEISSSYKLERIYKVEVNILRLAIYEMVYGAIPPKVAIAEAVRLCRKFSSSGGGSFVNAVLDAFYKDRYGDK